MRLKVVYFVHDLNDPAVHRRVRMLQATRANVTLLGFCRGEPPRSVATVTPICLGKTVDGRLGQRIRAVLSAAMRIPQWRSALHGADVVIARQLETLAVATMARRHLVPNARLVYECLDVHRLMVDPGPKGFLLRFFEEHLLRQCQALIVSSPEFVRSHFVYRYRCRPPVHLLENKVLGSEVGDLVSLEQARQTPRQNGPPWRIGWFGVIRCSRSLDLLAALVRSQRGTVEVIIRGRIARDIIPDFDAILNATPGIMYLGPYDRHSELLSIYQEVHFAWAIDYFEAGANSDWLLPNRIYEGGLFGTIPIARDGCATADWLHDAGVGITLLGDPGVALRALFTELDDAKYVRLASEIRALPRTKFLYTDADCVAVMQAILAP